MQRCSRYDHITAQEPQYLRTQLSRPRPSDDPFSRRLNYYDGPESAGGFEKTKTENRLEPALTRFVDSLPVTHEIASCFLTGKLKYKVSGEEKRQ